MCVVFMYVEMDVLMHGCEDVWMDVWMHVCMYGCMDVCMYGWMYILYILAHSRATSHIRALGML